MTEKLKWAGWPIACILFAVLLLQRSCANKHHNIQSLIHDTITIAGDKQLIRVQDTILMPSKTIYISVDKKVDTATVLKDYFAERSYVDTIKSRDVIAVIEDSIKNNKLAGRKVLIENTRDKLLTETSPRIKMFLGGFIGLSQQNFQPSAGIALSLISKNDVMYFYHYEIISRTHAIGLSLKLHIKN